MTIKCDDCGMTIYEKPELTEDGRTLHLACADQQPKDYAVKPSEDADAQLQFA